MNTVNIAEENKNQAIKEVVDNLELKIKQMLNNVINNDSIKGLNKTNIKKILEPNIDLILSQFGSDIFKFLNETTIKFSNEDLIYIKESLKKRIIEECFNLNSILSYEQISFVRTELQKILEPKLEILVKELKIIETIELNKEEIEFVKNNLKKEIIKSLNKIDKNMMLSYIRDSLQDVVKKTIAPDYIENIVNQALKDLDNLNISTNEIDLIIKEEISLVVKTETNKVMDNYKKEIYEQIENEVVKKFKLEKKRKAIFNNIFEDIIVDDEDVIIDDDIVENNIDRDKSQQNGNKSQEQKINIINSVKKSLKKIGNVLYKIKDN